MIDLVRDKAVIDYEESEKYYHLKVQAYGNCRFFSKLGDYKNGNVSTYDEDTLKVNIRK